MIIFFGQRIKDQVEGCRKDRETKVLFSFAFLPTRRHREPVEFEIKEIAPYPVFEPNVLFALRLNSENSIFTTNAFSEFKLCRVPIKGLTFGIGRCRMQNRESVQRNPGEKEEPFLNPVWNWCDYFQAKMIIINRRKGDGAKAMEHAWSTFVLIH